MGAKIGSIPWAIDDLPLTDKPTMIIGIDTRGKPGAKTPMVYGLVATTNNTYSNYFCKSSYGSKEYAVSKFVSENFKKAAEYFKKRNGILPKRAIFYREGISRGQMKNIKSEEISEIKKICEELKEKDEDPMMVVYLCVNKICNVKFFQGDNSRIDFRNMGNPEQGSFMSKNLSSFPDEFYLVS